jgi:aspartyl-tRNA(Asn)/glutamyl-tRNA(Gln) amidotransferase subunit A
MLRGVSDQLNVFITRCETTGSRRCGVKDLFHTAGIRTTYGSKLYADHVPTDDAVAWQRLRDDGWTLAGKTNLHEFAYGTSSQNPWYGTVGNPHDPGRVAGGSSGGSAAGIVTGDFEMGLGTDTAGSIRIPASWCGVVGFKPSHGAVPSDGCFALVPWVDHIGPIAGDVATCAETFATLARRPPATAADPASLAAVIVKELEGVGVEESVSSAFAAGVDRLREAGVATSPTDWERLPQGIVQMRLAAAAHVHRRTFPAQRELYGADVAHKLERGLEPQTTAQQLERMADAEAWKAGCRERLGGAQLVVMPTIPIGPPPVDVDEVSLRGTVFAHTQLFNHLGWPSITIPCGTDRDGLPVGMMLSGPGDDVVLGAALALEAAIRDPVAR